MGTGSSPPSHTVPAWGRGDVGTSSPLGFPVYWQQRRTCRRRRRASGCRGDSGQLGKEGASIQLRQGDPEPGPEEGARDTGEPRRGWSCPKARPRCPSTEGPSSCSQGPQARLPLPGTPAATSCSGSLMSHIWGPLPHSPAPRWPPFCTWQCHLVSDPSITLQFFWPIFLKSKTQIPFIRHLLYADHFAEHMNASFNPHGNPERRPGRKGRRAGEEGQWEGRRKSRCLIPMRRGTEKLKIIQRGRGGAGDWTQVHLVQQLCWIWSERVGSGVNG